MGGGGGWMDGLKPVAGMVLVQMVFAGVNIFYKLAVNDGMDMRVLVAYRYLFATAILAPLAFFLERKNRVKMTWEVLLLAFSCGLFGGSLAQNLYLASIRLISPTFAAAICNLIPAVTFILAVSLRLEALQIGSVSGQAKVAGTLLGVGGAMLLTFYKGVEINIWHRDLNLSRPHNSTTTVATSHQESGNRVAGSLFGVMSCLSYSIWLIIQAKLNKAYPCHYSAAALMCFMSTAQSVLYAICLDRDSSMWRLGFNIRLFTVLYVGIVATGVSLLVMNWCIAKKGPLFASTFNPLMLVIVAALSFLLLNEKLHLGIILGAALIVVGLYMVIWGKKREAAKVSEMPVEDPIKVVIVGSGHKEVQDTESSTEPKT